MRDKKAVEHLIQSLEDQDIDVRWNAADAFGKLKDVLAVEPLIRALKDEDEFVRDRAANSLEK